MRFVVHGAHRTTGQEVTLEVEAADIASAEQQAAAGDILVSEIRPVTSNSQLAPVLDYGTGKPNPKPPMQPPPRESFMGVRKYRGLTWKESAAYALSVAAGVILLVIGCPVSYPSLHVDRFESDNAFGATANALEALREDMGRQSTALRGAVTSATGVLFLILASLIRLRATIRDAASTPPAAPKESRIEHAAGRLGRTLGSATRSVLGLSKPEDKWAGDKS